MGEDASTQPKFLLELHQSRHEKLSELHHLLEENFLQNEAEHWSPKPGAAGRPGAATGKALLRGFQTYAQSKDQLKVFRAEAVWTGFRRAWVDKDYGLIVSVAQRLPVSVLR